MQLDEKPIREIKRIKKRETDPICILITRTLLDKRKGHKTIYAMVIAIYLICITNDRQTEMDAVHSPECLDKKWIYTLHFEGKLI